ncbi:hypothetical protein M6D93_02245 [Jatrophihabitans telluris]|uniref:Acyl-CoA oxidase/dehydrogenase middle domain-containing protein n=1 Tax=Jatrophihabitans telluris TaxID=2038343 RepID=A0ABY4QYX0_9ACTN|nr:hypothetical protein [Jatrophihabitans telluris]UQX88833.1 hypothetical protein M6D93_02245 [Jatrophihabitans telluris]
MSAEPGLRARFDDLIATGAGELPLPGKGQTLQRWQFLAAVAAEDVGLVKLVESHADALAILAELGAPAPAADTSWAVWAAEPPSARLRVSSPQPPASGVSSAVTVSGRKAWCSGGPWLTHALVTAWTADERQCLVAIRLDHDGVSVTDEGWAAVGMGRVPSGDVLFDDVPATLVGAPGDYVDRAGFWHGGAGVAACWFGGVVPFVAALAGAVDSRDDPHSAAHFGAIDVSATSVGALLRATASWIDENPSAPAMIAALRAREAAEQHVQLVLGRAGRALGAGPLCRDPDLAQRFADLAVFVRQSHAERDLATLGRAVAHEHRAEWRL